MPDARSTTDAPPLPAEPAAQTDVYAIHGADPEVLAYAMAKYSRSSLTMKESLAEISSQRAEQFLNTFYFQYGHRSIADLAHIPFAIECLSLLAAIALVDESRWDGQERSTRYQNFRKSGWYTPQLPPAQATSYTAAVETLFAAYDAVGAGMLEALKLAIPQPATMKDEAYTRTLKARAFDVARYLLPLATNTSLGQIVNARTLETQISRLLSSEFAEVRSLGEKLREAASGPAWNVHRDEARVLCEEVNSVDPLCGCRVSDVLLRDVKAAPTLVKYASPNQYAIASRAELRHAAAELMADQPIEPAPVVDLVEDAASLEVELATSLLYSECQYSWRQLQRIVSALPAPRLAELVALGAKHRGRHDELLRAFSAGQCLKFDLLMDIGGFRDMHRHRRCVQLQQDYTDAHGYEEPTCPGQPTLAEAGLAASYASAMDAAFAAYRTLSNDLCHSDPKRSAGEGSPHSAPPTSTTNPDAAYLLPLGTRVRAMFKMDFAEALYISELRSGVAGHFSYRRVAWEMYLAVAKRHPTLARYFRIEDVNQPVDLLKR
jgi:thymidylate synthase ThyX